MRSKVERSPARIIASVAIGLAATLTISSCAVSDASEDSTGEDAQEALAYRTDNSTAVDATEKTPEDESEAATGDVVEGPVSEEDVVVFLAAGERMLADGPYEGLLYESPELYVAAAQTVCSRFSDGAPVKEVIGGFVSDSQLEPSAQADMTLAGTILGAGVSTLCPQHLHLLGSS